MPALARESLAGEARTDAQSEQHSALAAPVLIEQSPSNGAPLLSVIVPTFNERGNLYELVRRLAIQLQEIAWEVIFVDDDSPDGTAELARAMARANPHVRCLQRLGRRGLSSACVEGVMSSSAPYVLIMDGDLQHDESILPRMLQALVSGEADVAIGSRYIDGGGIGQWDDGRAMISRFATRLSHLVVPPDLKDPMSGFFMMRREVFLARARALSAMGFKILVDLFASGRKPLRFVEIPYQFRNRQQGESKLDNQAAWDYLMLLLDKLVGHLLPVRFIAFAGIGALGLAVHLLILGALFKSESLAFQSAQASATLLAMSFNFTVNNLLTYRDRRLQGFGWWRGLASFMLACSIGAIANVGIASYVFDAKGQWLLAALAGVVVGAVWNYAVTSVYTWGKPRH
ncbi:glycosyltransferase [Roseateles oligotrophus]|uniref:Glycosyltransferase family 2 protein n=1 Tax=Roseateles oligotrophus TaxID=1769250 RepID=A0ABT2YMP8_9BURK|nr:glycosyltransferase family 2 protein [Roseateles oligotrophus]MCV2371343.1 glycosyltransferase family 2 protein [Roseateles oligotrophus]